MWRNYVILQAELQSLEPTWTGLPDLNAAIVLGKGLEAASKAAPWYRSFVFHPRGSLEMGKLTLLSPQALG